MENLKLRDRIALVVGGGNGLGKAIAKAYAREGATLAIADLNQDAARETLAEIGQADRGLALNADIADPETAEKLMAAVIGSFSQLHILVNCAAMCLVDPLLDLSPERWDKVFSVNARGAFFCMQAAARVMIPKGHGRIIQISTPASRLGFPDFATYGASKAALDSLVRSAALAWAPHGITVNSIVPGRMTSGMILVLEQDLAKLSGKTKEELEKARTLGLPMKRRVSPEEVAESAVWLASEEAAYVTAERFNFTGGMELS